MLYTNTHKVFQEIVLTSYITDKLIVYNIIQRMATNASLRHTSIDIQYMYVLLGVLKVC